MKKLIICGLASLSFCAWGQQAIDRSEILRDPEWKEVYNGYVPDAGLIATLKHRMPETTIDVYLGLWCGDSRDHVPVFLKIMDALEAAGPKVNWYGVERKADPAQKYYAEERRVERVPTFIFLRGGEEKGRIVETPELSILEDMLAILLQ